MTQIASLPMYDMEELRPQTDALWQHFADAMRRAGVDDVPDSLTRLDSLSSLWKRRDLLLSQTCGYPLMRKYSSMLRPVATPRYSAPGCRGSEYCSVIVVRADNESRDVGALRDKVCAANSPMSQSGYNALRSLVAPLAKNGRFFSEVRFTGSHPASIEAVASGKADVCAVDCVSHALLMRYRPSALEGTRVMIFTPCCPGLPLVTRADLHHEQFRRLRTALHDALTDAAGEPIRTALLIDGVDDLEFEDYQVVLEMETAAERCGYAELR